MKQEKEFLRPNQTGISQLQPSLRNKLGSVVLAWNTSGLSCVQIFKTESLMQSHSWQRIMLPI